MASLQVTAPLRQDEPPQRLLWLMAGAGKWASQAICVATELGIPDLLKDGSHSTDEIAKTLGVHPEAIFRLLRALAGLGLFSSQPGRRFSLNPSGYYLCTDWPGSLRGWARFLGHDLSWRPSGGLLHSVRTGKPAFCRVFGMRVFDYLALHAEAAAVFHDAMTSISSIDITSVAEAYDFSKIRTLIDVGGGHGLLLATILKANAQMRGVLFDRPDAIEGAATLVQREGVSNRCTLIAGDFFSSIPEGGDAYILKSIIHDWDDDRAAQILCNCHRAMRPKAKLLLVERLLLPGDQPDLGKFIDLEMLTMTEGGRERSEVEFEQLFARNGFKLMHVTKAIPKSVIEAVRL
jgi:hypothetical protein